MQAQIVMPDVGSEPAQLSVWFADLGDVVYEGDRVVEVLVSGATFDVSAPATGRLVEQRAFTDQPVATGQLLGVLEIAAT